MRILIAAFLLTACATSNKKAEELIRSDRVSVLTFNVENLFDVEDDPDKNDEPFLPASLKSSEHFQNKCRYQTMRYNDKSSEISEPEEVGLTTFRLDECLGKDWSPRVLVRKMERLTDVLRQVNNGKGPDIVLLQEVENRKIVERWRDEYLQDMGYRTLLHIESPDERGIDTAILTRLEAEGEPTLHLIDYQHEPTIQVSDQRPTRGILEGRLKLPDGSKLAVFSLHFPSQGAGSLHRSAAVKTLMAVAAQVPAGTAVIVGGDFNITSAEEFRKRYYRDLIAKDFGISHQIGCKGCLGSTHYGRDNTWSFFDVLLFNKELLNEKSPWTVDRDSIRLVNSSRYQTDHRGKPAKFRTGKGTVGVSDHWPMYAEIKANLNRTAGAQ